MLGSLSKSPAIRATIAFGVSGVAFTVGNLLLARVLPATAYGVIALITGLLSITTTAAPLGIDQVVNRRPLSYSAALWTRTVLASTATAGVAAGAGAVIYGLAAPLLATLFVGTLAGGIAGVAAAYFQSAQRFRASVSISQASNITLLVAALVAAITHTSSAAFPCAILAAGYVAAAVAGVWMVHRDQAIGSTPRMEASWEWGEAISLVMLLVAGVVSIQLERLVIPRVLTYEDLATFGAVAAVVASPFRLLQGAVFYTMIPRLRAAASRHERRRILNLETAQVIVVMSLVTLAVWFVAPFISTWVLAGKYEFSRGLILAMLISGVLKVVSVFPTSVVSALGDRRSLRHLNILAWATTALSAVGGAAAARWGLTGLVWGVALGWLLRSGYAAILSLPHVAGGTEAP